LGPFGGDLLYPPGDAHALAERLKTLASTPVLARRLAEGLRMRALVNYQCGRMQSQIREIVLEVAREAG
jgi:glycosyltransferase involved in cell wall biosynthesis